MGEGWSEGLENPAGGTLPAGNTQKGEEQKLSTCAGQMTKNPFTGSVSDIYFTLHNNSQITVMKQQQR